MNRLLQLLLQLLFGLLMVVGVAVAVYGLTVEQSVALALVGGFTALAGLLGYNWLGE